MKDRINKNSCVLVFSGGQDSTTLLFHAKKLYKEIIAISFNYGQKHSLELECAKELCRKNERSEITCPALIPTPRNFSS